MEEKFTSLEEYTKKHRRYEEVLEITEYTNFKPFREIKQEFVTKQKIFNGIIDLQKYNLEWNEMKLMAFDVKEMTQVCDKYTKDLMTAERTMG